MWVLRCRRRATQIPGWLCQPVQHRGRIHENQFWHRCCACALLPLPTYAYLRPLDCFVVAASTAVLEYTTYNMQ
jgi:hypothetical protein